MGRYINKKASEWLKALESGNFKQTKGALFHKDKNGKSYSYCCLGVACQINDFKKTLDNDNDDPCFVSEKYKTIAVHDAPLKFLKDEFNFKSDAEIERCIEMNDEENMSFKQIAKELRKNSKQYFKKSK